MDQRTEYGGASASHVQRSIPEIGLLGAEVESRGKNGRGWACNCRNFEYRLYTLGAANSRLPFFRARCAEMAIHLVLTPVEIQLSFGLVERIHGPIRRIYHKHLLKRAQISYSQSDTAATKALNDTAGVKGLVYILLVNVPCNTLYSTSRRLIAHFRPNLTACT
jgi:hypothetical protein